MRRPVCLPRFLSPPAAAAAGLRASAPACHSSIRGSSIRSSSIRGWSICGSWAHAFLAHVSLAHVSLAHVTLSHVTLSHLWPARVRIGQWLALAALLGGLAGCAHQALDAADRLSRAGQFEAALATLDEALVRRPDDGALRSAQARQRDRVVAQGVAQTELALGAGQVDAAALLLGRLRRLAPQHPRLAQAEVELAQAQASQRRAQAEALAARRQAQQPPEPDTSPAPWPATLAAAFQKPLSLELREAPLRQVFEALARSSDVNFVFDKDVRGDAKVTVFLRQVTLDEAMRVVLATQGLDRKLLNANTVLVYPNTAAKQREHQELVTRSLYLTNADAKAALALVRTMTKTRDLYADERLNALVVRDTPEVVRQVERLIATLDKPEPEVMLAVEVMEVATSRVQELGLSWPSQAQYGLPGVVGQVALGANNGFIASVANPALLATLRGDDGTANLLANPTIRARNREKARVQIVDKLPVFSTTQVVNGSVSTSVSVTYVDVGLKLDVEPTIQLDGDVTIKVALEVSNLVREVSGPQGATAYQVGQRATTTTLRLQDGQTQVLAGLINDEDRKRALGVPGLSAMPVLGKLFGVHSDTRSKTEVVMLITPRIVRRLQPPTAQQATLASGTDSQPGAATLRLGPAAQATVAATRGTRAAAEPMAADVTEAANAANAAIPVSAPSPLQLVATAQAAVGDTVSLSLRNQAAQALAGELVFDGQALQPVVASAGAGEGQGAAAAAAAAGRLAFALAPGAEQVLLLRVLPAAVGRSLGVQVQGLPAEVPAPAEVQVQISAPAAAAALPGAEEKRP